MTYATVTEWLSRPLEERCQIISEKFRMLDESKRVAEAYQNGQRAFDKVLNPMIYNPMIGPDGRELMVEKHQIPDEWTR